MLNKKCQPNRLLISIIIALFCLISSYFFLFKGLQNSEASTTVQQVSVSERRMEIHEPSMPKNVIEITEIRNLQSSDFPSKFELDIKNVSDKPIFYVRFAAVLTNSRSYTPSGRPIGFDLFYGNRRLSSEREKAQKGDEPIPPGETATLRTIESNSRAMVIKAQREPEFASRGRSQLLLVLQIINFGDGTSFLNDKPYKHQDVSLNHHPLMDSMQSAPIHKFAFSHASVRKPDLNNDYSLGTVWFSNVKWDITQSNCEGSCFRFSTAQTQNGCSIPNCSTYYVEYGGFSLPCRCLQWVDWLCYYEETPVNCPSAFNFACPPGGGCLEL